MKGKYPNTFTGIIIVFCLLVSFCMGYYTIAFVTGNLNYAMISGITSVIIFMVGSGADLYLKCHPAYQKDTHSDLKPKGINEKASVYPREEDLSNIKIENRILYDKNHPKKANPVKGIDDPVDWEENLK